jgi:nucleoside-diphosphate-sugar epimerase
MWSRRPFPFNFHCLTLDLAGLKGPELLLDLIFTYRPDKVVIANLAGRIFAATSGHSSLEQELIALGNNVYLSVILQQVAKELHERGMLHMILHAGTAGYTFDQSMVSHGFSLTEYTPRDPANHYGVSMVARELFAELYFKQYGIPYKVALVGNAWGEGYRNSSVYSYITHAALQQQNKLVISTLKNTRPLIAGKTLGGILYQLLQDTKQFGSFIVASPKSYSLGEFIKAVESVTGWTFPTVEEDITLLRGSNISLPLSTEKLSLALGELPDTDMDELIKGFIAYQANP